MVTRLEPFILKLSLLPSRASSYENLSPSSGSIVVKTPTIVPAGIFSSIVFFSSKIASGASLTAFTLTLTWAVPLAVPISALYINTSIPFALGLGVYTMLLPLISAVPNFGASTISNIRLLLSFISSFLSTLIDIEPSSVTCALSFFNAILSWAFNARFIDSIHNKFLDLCIIFISKII